MKNLKMIRVFISSPSDVNPERDTVEEVIRNINLKLTDRAGVYLKPIRWETNVTPQMGKPQQIINEEVGNYDIYIGIMWARFGNEKGSGTEGEFSLAYERWEKFGWPHILFYFKDVRYDDQDSLLFLEQRKRVIEFKKKLFQKGVVKEFKTRESLIRHVERDLGSIIDRILQQDKLSKDLVEGKLEKEKHEIKTKLPGVTFLIGREKEQTKLKKWLLDGETGIIIVSGMAGMGKSALVSTTVNDIHVQFDDILYHEIIDTSGFLSFLHELGQVAVSYFICKDDSHSVETSSNLAFWQLVTFIMSYLDERKLLLILDNFENLLDRKGRVTEKFILAFFTLFEKFERSAKICLITRMSPQFVPSDFRKVKELRLKGLDSSSIEKRLD